MKGMLLMWPSARVYYYVSISTKRERERERERQTDRQRERDRQTDRQTDAEMEKGGGSN